MGVGFFPDRSSRARQFGGIGGWAPGQMATQLPEGTGYYLPKGADVVIQMHYHRTGKAEKDRTQDRPVLRQEAGREGVAVGGRSAAHPQTRARTGSIPIPAGKSDHKVDGVGVAAPATPPSTR